LNKKGVHHYILTLNNAIDDGQAALTSASAITPNGSLLHIQVKCTAADK